MRCSLRSANGELMMLVTLRFRFLGELCSWVVPKGADRLLELSDIVATFWLVCLAIVTPEWARWDTNWCSHLTLIRHLLIGLPVAGSLAHRVLGLLCLREHGHRLGGVEFGPPGVLEELWFVHKIVFDEVVGILGGYLVVTRLYRWRDAFVVISSKSLIVAQGFGSIRSLMGSLLVIISLQACLTWLVVRIGLISKHNKMIFSASNSWDNFILTRMI